MEERFELVRPDEIKYRYTVDDPKIYRSRFTVEMSIVRRPRLERLYEFACHEANYSFEGIMRGARILERESVPAEE